ncbi:MAG: ABC transporter substrate-binding protein [Rhizobiales bacterium]|nr:ABC transporter substrate-binding protein [Hyphomicrobiales bacterium]
MKLQSCAQSFLVALSLLFSIEGGAAAHAETMLKARINSDILSTDPGTKRDENTDGVVLHMVEGLVAFREDTSVGPLLAKSIVVSDDGLTYTFTLRDGVHFHNGALLTSKEVLWSLNRYLDPETHWRCLPEFDGNGVAKILSVTAPDAMTVRIKLDTPSPLFLTTLARQDCGGTGIMHPDSVKPDGSWDKPIGTGPFKFGIWKTGDYIELDAFNDYASRDEPMDGNTGGKKAEVDKVRFLVIPDSSAARAALLSGAIDVLNGVTPSELAAFKGRDDVTLDKHALMDIYAILLQTKDPLLQDVRIRQALALSIDRAALADAVSMGIAAANTSAVPVSSPFYGPVEKSVAPADIAAARKLLKEAGYKGEPIKLIANKRYPQMFDAAILVQAMAQQAGIKIDLEVLDWATELDRYSDGSYQAMSFSYSARLDPSLSFGAFMGDKALQPRKVWDDPEALELLRQSMTTQDKAERQALFDALHAKMLQQVPLIVLYNPAHVIATRNNVEGFRGWPTVQQRFWNVKIR